MTQPAWPVCPNNTQPFKENGPIPTWRIQYSSGHLFVHMIAAPVDMLDVIQS